jgi:endonuclease-3
LICLKGTTQKPKCALNYSTAEELLIATILSAQCTDERVNQVTESLFKKYPSLQSFAEAKLEDLEVDIRPTGFYKNKAKNIIHCCKTLLQEFGGQLPKTVEEMTQLGGVGRKTANVVLGNAFNIASGVVVDTHVTRLSNRLGWVKGRDAVKIEMQLNELVPKKYWVVFPHWMITHGRAVCKARKPRCEECFLEELCPKKPY